MRFKKFTALAAACCLLLSILPFSAGAQEYTLNEALNVPGGNLTFTNDSLRPWAVDSTSDSGRISAATDIAGIASATTTLTFNAGLLTAAKVLSFDWKVSSESGHDFLLFLVNGTPNKYISGQTGGWTTVKFPIPSDASYTFTWVYSKDNAVNGGFDRGWVDNVQVTDFVYITGLQVTPEAETVYINYSKQLTATVEPADATIQTITWMSSNPTVAMVDENGLVTALSQGTAVISATSDEGFFVAECAVTVPPPVPVTGVSLDFTSGVLSVGNSGKLNATVMPQYVTNSNVLWSSSNPSVASVLFGTVTAESVGNAIITVTTVDGSFTATCSITVVADSSLPNETQFTYSPVSMNTATTSTLGWNYSPLINYVRSETGSGVITYAKGYSVSLEAGRTYTFGTSGSTLVDTYINIYNPAFHEVAFDDDSGEASFSLVEDFVPTQTGTYYILVSGYNVTSTGTFTFHVSQLPPIYVTGVSFNPASVSIPVFHSMTLSYTIAPADAHIRSVTFASSNTAIVTVNAAGVITAVAPGTASVTVTTVDGGFTAVCSVTVTYTPVTSVNFDVDGVIVGLNKSRLLSCTVLPAAAEYKGLTFTSSNPSVAPVDANGRVTGLALGNAVITARSNDGGFTDTCSVMVVTISTGSSATVTLTAGNVWGDGTGYQMLMDADATAYGTLFQASGGLNTSGNVPQSVYDQFEFKIPTNADGVLTTTHIILNSSQTILVDAGTYDFCITNPVPGDRVWIATTSSVSYGRRNDFTFEAGYAYTFTVTYNSAANRDAVSMTSQFTGAGLSRRTVNYAVSGSGGTLTGKTQLLVDEGYVLTAADIPVPTPQTGYHFVGWSTSPTGYTCNADVTFTATFEINRYTVIFRDYDNTVLKTQLNVPYGTAATPPAAPNNKPYWHFTNWSVDFSYVTSNLTVVAVYAIDTYAVTLPSHEAYTAAAYGSSASPVPRGGSYSFTVTLTANYSASVITVKANGAVLTPSGGVYTIANILEPKTVTVEGYTLNPANYAALDAALALTPAYPDSYYTQTTIASFRSAVASGQAVSRSLNILSQSIVDAAANAISSAFNALVLKAAYYVQLDAAIAQTPPYADIYYTPASLTAYRNALSSAQAVPRNLNILSQSTVDSAAAALISAYGNLTLWPETTLLELAGGSPLSINHSTGRISGSSPYGMTASAMLAQFTNKAVITAVSPDGTPLTPGQLAATGTQIRLYSKENIIVDQATVIVAGDIDCNGLAQGPDAVLAAMLAAGMLNPSSLSAAAYCAADANGDGFVDSIDVQAIERAGLFLM